MKDIKVGDFVYHAKYGKGICAYAYGRVSISFDIIFENVNQSVKIQGREPLFKKGDLVVGERGKLNVEHYGKFLGWSEMTGDEKYDFLVLEEGGTSLFVHTLRHQEEKKEITLVLKVNGTEVSPSVFSEETWSNLRSKG